jgi:hypothetical protein
VTANLEHDQVVFAVDTLLVTGADAQGFIQVDHGNIGV